MTEVAPAHLRCCVGGAEVGPRLGRPPTFLCGWDRGGTEVGPPHPRFCMGGTEVGPPHPRFIWWGHPTPSGVYEIKKEVGGGRGGCRMGGMGRKTGPCSIVVKPRFQTGFVWFSGHINIPHLYYQPTIRACL